MKVGIVFGTRRTAATVEVVRWMKEHLQSRGHSVAWGKFGEFAEFDCDLYILGTAVYAFSARRTGVRSFLRSNAHVFRKRPTAVFLVCEADAQVVKPGDAGLKRILKKTFLDREKYLTQVTRLLEHPPLATTFFKGYQEPKDRDATGFDGQEGQVQEWCDTVIALVGTG